MQTWHPKCVNLSGRTVCKTNEKIVQIQESILHSPNADDNPECYFCDFTNLNGCEGLQSYEEILACTGAIGRMTSIF